MSYLDERRKYIEAGRPLKTKQKKPIAKKSEKRLAKEKEQNEAGSDNEMDKFFKSLRKGMKGKCLFCSGSTMKNDDDKFHFSLAHLLPKAYFKSVATMPENIIELCFYNNSCHTNFDNGMITWQFVKDSAEWLVIREKLLEVLPMVAEDERKHKLYDRLTKLVYSN